MSHHKPIYITGLSTGIACGLLSALTAMSTIHFIAAQDLETSNPFLLIALVSVVVGAMVGLLVSFLVHRLNQGKK